MKTLLTFFTLAFAVVLAGAPLSEEFKLLKMPHMKWNGTVASYSKGKMQTPEKGITACFTYPIIYDETGKPKGTSWPRCTLGVPRDLRNWSKYDYLEFKVYTTFNRSDEEFLPVTLGISGAKTKSMISYTMRSLRQNEWVKVSVPLRGMKKNEPVKTMQFHLNSRRYFPNDKLVLHVGDFKLVRITQWQLVSFKMTAPAIFSDRLTLPVQYELLGPGTTFAVPFRIYDSKGKKVRDISLVSKRGFDYRTLASGKLHPGKYTLSVFPDDKQRRSDVPFQVIAPPWGK